MIELKRVIGIPVLALNGDIGRRESVMLSQKISNLIEEGFFRIVLDLSNVHHLNFISVDVLMERVGRLKALQGDLRLAGLSSYVEDIFRAAGADGLFATFGSTTEAVQSFLEEEQISERPWRRVSEVPASISR